MLRLRPLHLLLIAAAALPVRASQIPNHLRVAQRVLATAPPAVKAIVGDEGTPTWRAYLAGAAALDALVVRAVGTEDAVSGGFDYDGHSHERVNQFIENMYGIALAHHKPEEQAFVLGLVTHFWVDSFEHQLVNAYGGYFWTSHEDHVWRHKVLEALESKHVFLLLDADPSFPVDHDHLVPSTASIPVDLVETALDLTYRPHPRLPGSPFYFQAPEDNTENWLRAHRADMLGTSQALVGGSIVTFVGRWTVPTLPDKKTYDGIREPLAIADLSVTPKDPGAMLEPSLLRAGDEVEVDAHFDVRDFSLMRFYLEAWAEAVEAAEAAIGSTFAHFAQTGRFALPENNLDTGMPFGQEYQLTRDPLLKTFGFPPLATLDLTLSLERPATPSQVLARRTLTVVPGTSGDGMVVLHGPQPISPGTAGTGHVATNAAGWGSNPDKLEREVLNGAHYHEALVLPDDLEAGTYSMVLTLGLGQEPRRSSVQREASFSIGEGLETRVVLTEVSHTDREFQVRVSAEVAGSGHAVSLGAVDLSAPGGSVDGADVSRLLAERLGSLVTVRLPPTRNAVRLAANYTGDETEPDKRDDVFKPSSATLDLSLPGTMATDGPDVRHGQLQVDVLDLDDATSLAGAAVKATTGASGQQVVYDLVAGQPDEVVTGTYTVAASFPGHAAREDRAVVVKDGELTHVVWRLPALRGTLNLRVEDADGTPLPQATVDVIGPTPVHGAPGSFDLAEGSYQIAASAPNYEPQSGGPIEVARGKPAAITLALKLRPRLAAKIWINPAYLDLDVGDGFGVEAKVLDDRNQEIAGAPLAWSMDDATVASVGGGTVRALQRGKTQLVVRSGTASGAIPVNVKSAAQLSSCTITNNPGALPARGGDWTFKAEARDGDGVVLEGVRYEWVGNDYTVALVDADSGHVTTEAPGKLTIIAHAFHAGAEALCYADLVVKDAATNLVSGRVVRADGSGIAGATVTAEGGPTATSAADGSFTTMAGGAARAEGTGVAVAASLAGQSASASGTLHDGRADGVTVVLAAPASGLPGFLAEGAPGPAPDTGDEVPDWLPTETGTRPAEDLGGEGQELLEHAQGEENLAAHQRAVAEKQHQAEIAEAHQRDLAAAAEVAHQADIERHQREEAELEHRQAQHAANQQRWAQFGDQLGNALGAIIVAASQGGQPAPPPGDAGGDSQPDPLPEPTPLPAPTPQPSSWYLLEVQMSGFTPHWGGGSYVVSGGQTYLVEVKANESAQAVLSRAQADWEARLGTKNPCSRLDPGGFPKGDVPPQCPKQASWNTLGPFSDVESARARGYSRWTSTSGNGPCCDKLKAALGCP